MVRRINLSKMEGIKLLITLLIYSLVYIFSQKAPVLGRCHFVKSQKFYWSFDPHSSVIITHFLFFGLRIIISTKFFSLPDTFFSEKVWLADRLGERQRDQGNTKFSR